MAKKVTANGKTFTFDDNVTNEQIGSAVDEYFSSLKKNENLQPVAPTISEPLSTGSKPFQDQVDTSVPSVLLTDEQKKQSEKERIGKRFETTLLDVPTEFGKVGRVMQAAKQVKETLPQAPEFRKFGEIPRMQPTQMTEGQRLGESLTKGEDFQDVITDKLTNKKTGLQKQLENAENAFRIYQGDEIANAAQGYIRPEETLKIKEELGFGEKMSNQGKNFVNQLEKFPYNSALAIGQTLNALLGEDLGGAAYRSLNAGGDVNYHRMVAFNELDKLNAESKYGKGLVDSITDLDLPSAAAAVSGAVLSLIGTVITSAPTAGVGLYTDMVGGGLYDYNSTKANRLGISVNELYETGQNDFFAPAIIAGAGAQLEKIGLKGIKKGILSNLKGKSAQKAGLIFHNSNKEGVTEWTQTGLEAYSNALAEGKNAIQAGEIAVSTMFSKKGAESYLMGAVASGAAIGGGRILKGLTSSKSKKVAAEAIDKIEQQQQELNKPEISEESRVFIFENIKNNVKQLVDVIDSDVEESDNLSDTQKKEIFKLNKTIEALEVVVNDPAVSEETKVSAQAKIDEYNKRINEIESAPIAPKPKIETREDIIKEIRAAEAEMERTGDFADYKIKIDDLNQRLENLVPAPEESEIAKQRADRIAEIESILSGDDATFAEEGKRPLLAEARTELKAELEKLKKEQGVKKEGKPKAEGEDIGKQYPSPAIVVKEFNPEGDNELLKGEDYDYQLQRIERTIASAIKAGETAEQIKQRLGANGHVFLLGSDTVTVMNYIQKRIDGTEDRPFQDFVKNTRNETVEPTIAQPTQEPTVGALKDVESTVKALGDNKALLDEKAKKLGYIGIKQFNGQNLLNENLSNEEKALLQEYSDFQQEVKSLKDENVIAKLSDDEFSSWSKANDIQRDDLGKVVKDEDIELASKRIRILNARGDSVKADAELKKLKESKKKDNWTVESWKERFDEDIEQSEIDDINKSNKEFNQSLDKAVENLLKPKTDAIQEQTAGQVPVLTEATAGQEVEQGKPEPKVKGVAEEGAKAEEVARLRAEEQAEIKAKFPNAEYKADGKIDVDKLSVSDQIKYGAIYMKYDNLISPLLPKKKTKVEEVAPAKEKAAPRLKPKVETRVKFKKAIELFNDISATKGGAKKSRLAAARRTFLEKNPSIKYIDDNWRKISDQLKAKGLIETKGNCP